MISKEWMEVLNDIFEADWFKNLIIKVNNEYKNNICFPPAKDIYNALRYTPYSKVKVVILGQDPYHGEGEAHGLSFSVKEGTPMPPSLKNIFKELNDDLGIEMPKNGSLVEWAKKGVLLLNSVLTVQKDMPASHAKIGWQEFTDEIIKRLNDRKEPIVFILWGNYARNKKILITNNHHYVIESTHPSPFSANYGFFGSKPFSKTNNFFKSIKKEEIDFRL